ncbi:mechanosensitive ion channel family protein [Algoriphagus vanfongensis]|uniref:mechanosensitive ion channel family protein n=1 Tax=Algoriphagus vanfongensis TaxID=426371 RepID=UPI000A03BA1B|nr:mechanosensitive ion channel family protein [Algoriphagus vanfongensis]
MRHFLQVSVFSFILILVCSLGMAQDKDSLQVTKPLDSIPVIFFEDTLHFISHNIGPFSPQERAERMGSKLNQLVEEGTFDTTLLSILEEELVVELLHGEQFIGSVSQKDADNYGLPMVELATMQLQHIKDTFKANHPEHNLTTQLIRVGILVGILIGLIILIRLVNMGFDKLIKVVFNKFKHLFKGIRIKNFEVISVIRQERLFLLFFRGLKVVVIAFLLYLSLPLIFSVFPTTKALGSKLLSYIIDPLKAIVSSFLGYIPELFMILVISVITFYIVKFVNFISEEVEHDRLRIPGFYPDWARPTFNLAKVIIIAFSFIVIFPYLPGSDSPAFQGVSVFLGLLISLGSSSAISNIIAGLVIIYMRAFKLGDRVKIGDTTGDVVEKTMLVTKLKTIKNEEVTIPNSAILNGKTINYSSVGEPGLILHTTITIGYDVPWRQVHELLINAVKKTELLKTEPAPFVLQTSLDDFYVSYQINAYTEDPQKAAKIHSDLHANIQDGFNESGVEIMSPHYRATRKGDGLAMPPQYIPEPETSVQGENKLDNSGE